MENEDYHGRKTMTADYTAMSTQVHEQNSAPEAPMSVRRANVQSIGILLLSVTLAAIGQLLFKAAVNATGELQLSLDALLNLGLNPLFLLGLGTFGASTFLWLLVLMKAEISFAYPFLSLSYMFVIFGGAVLFGETLTISRVFGVVVIIGGIFIIARSEKSTS